MSKFKVGDRVRVTGLTDYVSIGLRVGSLGTVRLVHPEDDLPALYEVCMDAYMSGKSGAGDSWAYWEEELEAAEV